MASTAAVHRAARIFVAMVALDAVAAMVTNVMWQSAVLPFIVGWCLSWLTAVAWVAFQETRHGR